MDLIIDIAGILVIIILLGAGAASILIATRLYRKFRQPFLQSYLYYQFLTVAFGMYGLLGSLLAQRILQSIESPARMVMTVGHVIPFIGIPFFITGLYMFVKTFTEMTKNTISRRFTLFFFLFHLLFFLVYGIILLKIPVKQTEAYTLFPSLIRYALIFLQMTIMTLSMFILFRGIHHMKETAIRMGLRNFGLLFFAIQIVTLVLFLLSDLSIYLTIAYLFFYFAGALLPLIYLLTHMGAGWYPAVNANGRIQLAEFYTQNEITRREKEIIELILNGLTNQEIADDLFITLQTVKDHTHNIFLKTGVRNRVELINVIREHKKV